MLGLGWEQHFKRIVRELIALTYVLDSCFFSFFFFFSLSPFFSLLVLIGAVLVTGVPV